MTDALAWAPYDGLEMAELDELVEELTPIAAALDETGSS